MVVAISLGTVAASLAVLALVGTQHIRNVSEAVRGRELITLQQYARLAAREVSFLMAQEEGAVLNLLDLTSPQSLIQSLARVESDFAGIICFALMDDGLLLYPPPETSLQGSTSSGGVPMQRRWEQIAIAEDHRLEIAKQARRAGRARVYLVRPGTHFIASVHLMQSDGTDGIIGISWSPQHVAHWCQSAALNILPEGYSLRMRNRRGNYLLQGVAFDTRGTAPGLSATHPLDDDMFPWVAEIAHEAPTDVAGLVRRQVSFYALVLAVLALLIVAGAWMLTAVTLREIELGRLKADFAANVSHELRTPLALIRAAGDALSSRRDLGKPRTDRYLSIISRESQRLTDLINTVLSFAEHSRKQDPRALVPTNVCRMLRDFLEEQKWNLEEKGFSVQLDICEEDAVCKLNTGAIHLVLINLIDNAAKFSPQRKEIRLAVRRSNHNAAISVSDKGIGIAPGDQDKIFDGFYRVERSLVKRTRGTGIGLALAQQIVDAHGGSMEVESKLGQGSTFTVLLPLCEEDGQG